MIQQCAHGPQHDAASPAAYHVRDRPDQAADGDAVEVVVAVSACCRARGAVLMPQERETKTVAGAVLEQLHATGLRTAVAVAAAAAAAMPVVVVVVQVSMRPSGAVAGCCRSDCRKMPCVRPPA